MTERIEKLQQFLKNTPGDSFLLHALALEYIKLDNDPEAARAFEYILENDPGYVGSYYHFARLLERSADRAGALQVYEKGMEEAKKAGDGHAFNELRAAYEDLVEQPD